MPDASDRRAKALRVIDHYGGDLDDVLTFIRRNGGIARIATDEQLAAFAVSIVEGWRLHKRLNRENRARAGGNNG